MHTYFNEALLKESIAKVFFFLQKFFSIIFDDFKKKKKVGNLAKKFCHYSTRQRERMNLYKYFINDENTTLLEFNSKGFATFIDNPFLMLFFFFFGVMDIICFFLKISKKISNLS